MSKTTRLALAGVVIACNVSYAHDPDDPLWRDPVGDHASTTTYLSVQGDPAQVPNLGVDYNSLPDGSAIVRRHSFLAFPSLERQTHSDADQSRYDLGVDLQTLPVGNQNRPGITFPVPPSLPGSEDSAIIRKSSTSFSETSSRSHTSARLVGWLPDSGETPSHPPGLQVWKCERVPQVTGGTAIDSFGFSHEWLVLRDSAGDSLYAVGLGNADGVPGGGAQSSPDCVGDRTFIKDHSDQIPRSCVPEPLTDPECVFKSTPLNQYRGRWVPFVNDCNTFVDDVVTQCQILDISSLQLLNPQKETAWDRAGSLEEPKTTHEYRLIEP